MSECKCDARFSGNDEIEYAARGCPACTCTCEKPTPTLVGRCHNCYMPSPEPEAPTSGANQCSRELSAELQRGANREPAKDAGAREWKILKCSNNGDSFIHGDDTIDNEFVHVIEYAAYERLERELAEANLTITTWRLDGPINTLHEQLTQERTRSAALVEAVDRIMRDPKYTSQIAIAVWEAALKKYGGGE